MPRRWNRIGAGHRRAGARCVKADLLAGQVLQRVYVRAHEQVHVADVHAGDVVDALLDVGDLLDRLEVLEHVGIGEGDVNALQVKQVLDVVGGAVGDHRDHAQLVAVVEIAGYLGPEADERALRQAAGETDRPIVDLGDRLALADGGRGRCRAGGGLELSDLERGPVLVRRDLGPNRRACNRNGSEQCQAARLSTHHLILQKRSVPQRRRELRVFFGRPSTEAKLVDARLRLQAESCAPVARVDHILLQVRLTKPAATLHVL